MTLIDELKEMREEAKAGREMQEAYVIAHQSNVDEWTAKLADLDTAIAALEPAPAEPEAEPLPTMDDIIDPDFTGGMTSEQYLARLHAGTLDEPEPSLFDADDIRRIDEAADVAVEALSADPEPSELDAEPASVLDNPELLAAVERAQQTLDAEPAAYVGLNDPELDDAWDAMKRREAADMEAKEKTERSFWALMGKRKLEEVS